VRGVRRIVGEEGERGEEGGGVGGSEVKERK